MTCGTRSLVLGNRLQGLLRAVHRLKNVDLVIHSRSNLDQVFCYPARHGFRKTQ